MKTKLVLSALSALALAVVVAGPALATPPPPMGTYKWTPPVARQAQAQSPAQTQAPATSPMPAKSDDMTLARHPCFKDLQAVQAEWNTMTPMGMGNASDEGGHLRVRSSTTRAKAYHLSWSGMFFEYAPCQRIQSEYLVPEEAGNPSGPSCGRARHTDCIATA